MTIKRMQKKTRKPVIMEDYDGLLSGMISLIDEARRVSSRTINAIMTATYWEIGRRIVESEQAGKRRAGYGETLLKQLSADLKSRFGRGFAKSNLYQMRAFYFTYQDILQTPSGKSQPHNSQTPSAELSIQAVSEQFPLPWSAYVRLLSVRNEHARTFYEQEALRGGWSVRQLDRQINSQFYERTALSKNKAAMLTRGAKPKPQDAITPEEQIKDPYVLEFLNLKDEYSESDLEEALILEYDGVEYHTKNPDIVTKHNFSQEYLDYDISRQIELESYGYRFLRLNKFNLRPGQEGETKTDVLDRLLKLAFAVE